MKKSLILLFCTCTVVVQAQKFIAEKSAVSFFSKATIEDIKADNAKSSSIFNSETGEIAFSFPIKEFKFDKKLMQEHFNEKYMDSEKYPKSTFQGKIIDYQMTGTGAQSVKAQGKLTIHGITKDIDVPGTFEVEGNKITMKSKFMVKLEDYEVPRPQLLWKNIAEEIEISIDFTFKPYEAK
ncbi:MAG: YceI family protein [Cyclobacteriaceae bacterium]|nr:YceI family protein [Cyclobacteriaceae bacterium]